MRSLLVFLLLSSLTAATQTISNVTPYDSVGTFIGTGADGNTFPGATLPFGMIQWSPDTRPDGWYHYQDKTLRGFSLTHISGAGCTVYADVPILPWVDDLKIADSKNDGQSPSDLLISFSHDQEQAHPGYYSVTLGNGVKIELTVTKRAGIGRFTFPSNSIRTLLFKAASSATIDDPHRESDNSTIQVAGDDTITGTVHSGGFCQSDANYVLYFAAKFAKPFSAYGTWPASRPGRSAGSRYVTGRKDGAYVSFDKGMDPIVVKIGISFVSVQNAEANLAAEIPGWDFDSVHTAAKKQWTEMFDRVQVDGGTPDQRTIFYTGLYHMLLSPNIFSDENGDYIGFDQKVRRLPAGQAQYANFSDWDIYRSLINFDALLMPAQTSQMMESLVRDAEQSGRLPKWPFANDVSYVMGGDSPSILLANAYSFGAKNFDTATALRYMLKGATDPGLGPHDQPERPGLRDYLSKGYVPVSDTENSGASFTLEYDSADFAVSQFSEAMGDKADAAKLLSSAQNWRKLFDPQIGFIHPKTADGDFIAGFDPDNLLPHRITSDTGNQMGFEEGSTWQYTWMVPFNYAGLFKAMGGNENVIPKLDKFFEKLTGWGGRNFTVANEPDFCTPFAYVWTGNAWKTQEVVDRIRKETFTTKPDGLPGNDDLGATSGVYVWNALGMYPVIPGVGGLVLGTPMFSHAMVKLGNGSTLEIKSNDDGVYVQSAEVNGNPYNSAWLPLDKLNARHNIVMFTLGNTPNKSWASKPDDLPPSFDVPEKTN
jgi:predicted alpha-1,2-mannosidase